MSQIVRRAAPALQTTRADEELPVVKTYRDGGLQVESHLTLGIAPRLGVTWSVPAEVWADGYTLYVFRSDKGFCPEQRPDDLNGHGQLVAEVREDGRYEEQPPEGTYFYTLVLHKAFCFGWFENTEVVRFSEAVPTGKVALGRVRDRVELTELAHRQELGAIAHDGNLTEAELRRLRLQRELNKELNPPADPPPPPEPPTPTAKALAAANDEVDAVIERAFVKQKRIAAVKADPRYQELGSKERKAILRAIEEQFDPAEINARREMHGG